MQVVRKLFYVVAAVIALLSPAFAGERNCEDCDLYRHGVHRQVIPTPDTVCVYFVQPKAGNILLRLALKNGTTRPYTKKNAGTTGCIPVGRDWLRQATAASYLCNDVNHFDYAQEGMIEALAKKPKYSRDVEACLFGKTKCREMGYPAYE